MESGLEDRNNSMTSAFTQSAMGGLNGVRPRRPEQSVDVLGEGAGHDPVSMESGLEDRNN